MRQAFTQRLNAVIGWTLCPHLADRCCTDGMEIYTQIVVRAFLTGIINTLSPDKNEVQEVLLNQRKKKKKKKRKKRKREREKEKRKKSVWLETPVGWGGVG